MEKLERFTKIISAIAIPLIVAWFGWNIQESISDKNLNRDYVKIALDIMRSESEVDNSLTEWAVDLLNENSPTQMSDEVIAKLKEGKVKFPTSKEAYQLYAENRLDESLDSWNIRIQSNPSDYSNYFNRSSVYRKVGKLNLAVKDLDRVISLLPNHATAYNNRGRIKIDMNKIDEACLDFQIAIQKGSTTAVENAKRFCKKQ